MIAGLLSIHDYHASKRVSSSRLRTFEQKGARGYYIAHEQREWTPDDTAAFRTGRAAEDALQRPDDYRSKYIAKPDGMSFSTREGKVWRTERQAEGLTILDTDDARAIEALAQTLDECPTARALMQAGAQQPSILHDQVARWPAVPGVQARPDWLCLEGCPASEWRPFVLDMKTTSTLAQLATGRSIIKYSYHRQAAMVRLCLELEGVDTTGLRFLLLGAEKAFPHRWRVIEIPVELVDDGHHWCVRQLEKLNEHYELGEWPLVETEIVTADVPAWLVDEGE